MASSYTGLGTELMTTGENAGTWGSTTNTNLQIIEQMSGGYIEQAVSTTTTLSVSDGSTDAVLAHRIIKFTGTLSANATVTIPLDVQQMYILVNGTGGAYTLTFKYVSGSGSTVAWAATDKGTKIVYAAADHATNPNMVDSGIGSTAGYDLDGNELTLDADSDTSITASTDDQIDIEIAGADDFTFTANAFNVLTGSHATFADSANAKFGTGNDMLLYHDGSNSYITNAQGALKIATESSGIAVTIGHTTSEVTVADNLTVTGTLTGTLATAAQGTVTSLGTLTTLTVDNIITNGTTIGHTSDTDLLTLTSGVLTVAGELDATTLDISGNADIDGTTNLDAVDIDGAVQIDGAVTTGVDDTGVDVKFFGATSGSFLLWDESDDALELTDSSPIKIGDSGDMQVYHDGSNSYITNSQGALKIATESSGIAVTIGHTTSEVTVADNLTVTGTLTLGSGAELTEAELEFLDGITAGTAAASKAMVLDSSADITGGRNLTISGELDAATLDISGDADIDGTLETDALSIASTTITTTAAEINLIDGGTSRGTTAVASGDGILINDAGTMRMTNVDTVSTYFASHNVGGGNIVTTGALDSGSITSGFGAIDNGTSNIRSATITAETAFVPDASGGADLGTTALEFNDLFLNDSGSIQFGDDQDTTLVHTDGTGLTLNSTNKFCFRDTALFINSSTDGQLDIDADTEVEITATTVDVNGILDVSGVIVAGGQISAADGTAGAPSISNTGDLNSGLYFSAADTLAFSAGGTAQFTMADGAIAPVTDNDVDLGTSGLEFKDGYFDGTLYCDVLNLNGTEHTTIEDPTALAIALG